MPDPGEYSLTDSVVGESTGRFWLLSRTVPSDRVFKAVHVALDGTKGVDDVPRCSLTQSTIRWKAYPTRPLGRTGFNVSALALGGVMYNSLEDQHAAALVHRAIDLGIN